MKGACTSAHKERTEATLLDQIRMVTAWDDIEAVQVARGLLTTYLGQYPTEAAARALQPVLLQTLKDARFKFVELFHDIGIFITQEDISALLCGENNNQKVSDKPELGPAIANHI